MFAHRNITSATVADLERIETTVRSRYRVPKDQIVLVTQEPARLIGGPDQMTTVLFWIDAETRYKVRLFKPVSEVSLPDFPPFWLRSALLDDELADCC
ncbi:MAG: nitrate reductase delta subunit [Yoonia sp.]|jgi:hypothetical protein